MTTDPGPFDLASTRLILNPEADAIPKAVTPNFYGELDAEFDGFAGHVLISQHEFDEACRAGKCTPREMRSSHFTARVRRSLAELGNAPQGR